MSKDRPDVAQRAAFGHFLTMPTRWMDNDAYGHINNVVYYSYFDTLVNRFLIDEGGLDYHNGEIVGIIAESACNYWSPFVYPEDVEGALAVGRLGTSSVRYEIGLFGTGDEAARAQGHFVHVFVARDTMRPVPIPDQIRNALQRLLHDN
ncbi:MAG: acyl-CoA thioesterase [Hyphomicrobiaceae bacterium]